MFRRGVLACLFKLCSTTLALSTVTMSAIAQEAQICRLDTSAIEGPLYPIVSLFNDFLAYGYPRKITYDGGHIVRENGVSYLVSPFYNAGPGRIVLNALKSEAHITLVCTADSKRRYFAATEESCFQRKRDRLVPFMMTREDGLIDLGRAPLPRPAVFEEEMTRDLLFIEFRYYTEVTGSRGVASSPYVCRRNPAVSDQQSIKDQSTSPPASRRAHPATATQR